MGRGYLGDPRVGMGMLMKDLGLKTVFHESHYTRTESQSQLP
jgi:hypothetical protein